MSQSHIRLARTEEIDKVLKYLKGKYRLLSDAEIIKIALSEKYYKEIDDPIERERQIREAYKNLMAEGKKLGDKLLAEKGLKRENVTEEEFYNLIIDPQNAENRS